MFAKLRKIFHKHYWKFDPESFGTSTFIFVCIYCREKRVEEF